ncbi:MAG: SIS domain-containing protein [Anaerolineales bacterium]|nr:SIS domain-containing protein [Anaerolineales bacterium]
MRLDDLDYLRSLDSRNWLAHLEAWPDQLAAAWALGQTLAWPAAAPSARQVVVVGRGDSAIAGELALAAVAEPAGRPVIVWPRPGLPAWLGPQTLVLALSHSGRTADTVAAAEAALARGAAVVGLASGGRLLDLPGVTAWRYPASEAPDGLVPLAALTLAALAKLEAAPEPAEAVAEAGAALRAQQASLRADSPVRANPAKRMAGQLMDRYAALFVADELTPAGRWWQGQINQLAKAGAQCVPLAEADHALAGRFLPEALIDKYLTLFLRGPAAAAALDEVRLGFMTAGYNTDVIAGQGRSRLAQLLTLAHYGSYAAFYLAACYGVDPAAREG